MKEKSKPAMGQKRNEEKREKLGPESCPGEKPRGKIDVLGTSDQVDIVSYNQRELSNGKHEKSV